MKFIIAFVLLIGISLWVLKIKYNLGNRWIFIISFLASLMFPCYIIWKRINIYPYDVNKNYEYNFIEESTDKTFEIKEMNLNQYLDSLSNYKSGFIEIDISSTPLGNIIQPRVKISSLNFFENQYFEFGVNGIRYINISNFIKNKDLSLDFRFCKHKNESIKIHLFKAGDLGDEKILILAPHPDDAEIGAFGLYSSYPKNMVVVTITSGDTYNFFSNNIENNKEVTSSGKIRIWNSISIPLLAGIEQQNVINLGYFDGTLDLLYNERDTSNIRSPFNNLDDISIFREINFPNTTLLRDTGVVNSSWTSLIQDISFIIEQVKPTIIITPHPILDAHIDHLCTTLALFEVLENYSWDNLQVWMYTNHFRNRQFSFENYPEGPMGSVISLPPIQNDSLFLFDKIYSHSLSNETQVNKAVALDAHIALRLPLISNYNNLSLFRNSCKMAIQSIHNTDISYYRRSVRSNELFFIVYPQNVKFFQEYKTGDFYNRLQY